jgi:hypothetical protein
MTWNLQLTQSLKVGFACYKIQNDFKPESQNFLQLTQSLKVGFAHLN